MAKVRIDFECLKELIKDEPLLKLVDELPSKESASPNYIYLLNNAEDKKAYVLKPDRSGYESIDLSPQLINVLGEGYITVDKETLNENGDVTFTVKADETLKTLLKTLGDKVKELEGKTDNDSQTLTLDGNTLTISNGNSVTLPSSTSSAKSAYSADDNISTFDSFIKGDSFTGSDENFSFPRAQMGKLEALVSESGRLFLRTQHAEGGTISKEVKDINPVKVAFITYKDESESAKVITKFLDDNDDEFKDGRLEVLDNNTYPTLLRYKDSFGKTFRITDGLDYGSLHYASLSEDGNVTFDANSIYNKVLIESSVTSRSDSEDRLFQHDRMKSKNNLDDSIVTSKIYVHKSGTIFEIVQMVDGLGMSPSPELKSHNRYKLTYIAKSYIDDKVYISKFTPSILPIRSETNSLEALVKVKEDGVIKDINVQVGFPAITQGV